MSSINFYLKSATKRDEALIMMTYLFKGQKFRYSTELKISPSSWRNQRVKPNISGYAEINSILDDLENTLKSIEREAIFSKKDLTLETIKRKFFESMGKAIIKKDFFSVYDHFINESKSTKAANTIKAYEGTKRMLLSFSKAKNIQTNFENINQIFYEAFVNYLIKDLGYLNNTVGKHIKTLKVFLRYAVDHEYTNQNYNFKKFKVFSEDADIIYLTEPELMKFYELDNLSGTLSKVRDIFCFACFTGLRFSDINKLSRSNIKSDFIEIRTDKTKDSLKIPLTATAKAILEKYKNSSGEKVLPTGLSNQKTNFYLKQIGKIAELQEAVCIEKYTGAKKIHITKSKSELITTHTARRTFVTLSLEKGIRAEVVMAITGHKSYRIFKKYIKITDRVMQLEMKKFWDRPLLKVV